MKSNVVPLFLVGLTLSACGTTGKIPGPGDERISARDACGDERARRNCVPDTGGDFYLGHENFNILLRADGRPNVLTWLGTLQPVGNLTGERGTPCSNDGSSPFVLETDVPGFGTDETPAIYGRTRKAVKTVEVTVSATLKGDLISALATAGVPAAVINRLDATINAAVTGARNATFEVDGVYRQYQLRPSLLDMLDAPSPTGYGTCIALLRSGEWQMYEAVTGWEISKATMSTQSVDTLTADLLARVAAEAPAVDIATLKANLTAKVTTGVTTADEPHFLIVGLSYWEPRRHPMPVLPRRLLPF